MECDEIDRGRDLASPARERPEEARQPVRLGRADGRVALRPLARRLHRIGEIDAAETAAAKWREDAVFPDGLAAKEHQCR